MSKNKKQKIVEQKNLRQIMTESIKASGWMD